MKHKKVIILGSGLSILQLTKKEIEFINKCEFVIALNKFSAFYKIPNIRPTHIYFHDLFGIEILIYIIKVMKKDNFGKVTIFTNSFINNIVHYGKIDLYIKILKDLFYYRFISLLKIILKLGVNCDIHKYKLLRDFNFIKIPQDFNIISLRLTPWDSEKSKWGNSLKERLFHYRGSLTTVLNIISIIAPNREICLVGTDFNGDKYFYEKELDDLGIPWKDFTYEKVKKHKIHFSFQKLNGKTMGYRFPYITQKLKESGNNLTCNNESSLLVTQLGVEYKELIDG
jgi:hypothetical protein